MKLKATKTLVIRSGAIKNQKNKDCNEKIINDKL
jgi:hypothetical protein